MYPKHHVVYCLLKFKGTLPVVFYKHILIRVGYFMIPGDFILREHIFVHSDDFHSQFPSLINFYTTSHLLENTLLQDLSKCTSGIFNHDQKFYGRFNIHGMKINQKAQNQPLFQNSNPQKTVFQY